MAQHAESTGVGSPTIIRPFHYKASEMDLADMKRRIKSTRWPEKETVNDDSQGVQLATTQALAKYWGDGYDWRKVESRLAALPNFITNIDGLDIHFIHVCSKHANALPIIVTHGWPGSIIEQLKIIEPLTDPTARTSLAFQMHAGFQFLSVAFGVLFILCRLKNNDVTSQIEMARDDAPSAHIDRLRLHSRRLARFTRAAIYAQIILIAAGGVAFIWLMFLHFHRALYPL